MSPTIVRTKIVFSKCIANKNLKSVAAFIISLTTAITCKTSFLVATTAAIITSSFVFFYRYKNVDNKILPFPKTKKRCWACYFSSFYNWSHEKSNKFA